MAEMENKNQVKEAPQNSGNKEHPEIAEMKARIFDISTRGEGLTTAQKYLVLIATTAAQGYASEAKKFASAALKAGVEPAAIKEAAMQTIPLGGFKNLNAVLPSLVSAMVEAGVKFPLPPNGTVTNETRHEEAIKAQVALFGESVLDWRRTIPEDQKKLLGKEISEWLFGDFYTRTGLSLKDRELVTFAILVALPDCEPELETHAKANLNLDNSRQMLLGALEIAMPLNGVPKTLNALKILNKLKETSWDFYRSISLHL